MFNSQCSENGRNDELRALQRERRTLQVENGRLRFILGHITEAYFILDPGWNMIEINPAAEDMLERPSGSLKGKNIWDEFPQAVGREFYQAYHRSRETGQPEHFEAQSATTGRWFEIHAYPKAGWLEVYFKEISARKQLEIERKRAEVELAQYAEKLQKTNRELEEFVYIASHDLQEPLRKIRLFGGILRDRLGPDLEPELGDYLERMLNASDRMSTMITGLLALSRAGTQEQIFQVTDLNQVAAEVISDLEPLIQASQAQVLISDLPVIQAEPLLMHQLFQNLLGNALKFHQPGKPPVVRVISCLAGDKVEIHVQDDGIGFDVEHLERIFQPFQRLHGRSQYEGSGIGLAICKKIVERHGGTISAQSQPGEGTTFLVALPYGDA